MISKHVALPFIVALATGLGLAACKKSEPTPPPVQTTPAPAQAQAPVAATVSVASVALGAALDADKKIATPTALFKPTDTIYLLISTVTSDPAATVPGKLDVKWTYQDGQTVNEESVDVDFTGEGATEFHISKPDGFPAGKYKVEVSLDGNLVQAREFDVQ